MAQAVALADLKRDAKARIPAFFDPIHRWSISSEIDSITEWNPAALSKQKQYRYIYRVLSRNPPVLRPHNLKLDVTIKLSVLICLSDGNLPLLQQTISKKQPALASILTDFPNGPYIYLHDYGVMPDTEFADMEFQQRWRHQFPSINPAVSEPVPERRLLPEPHDPVRKLQHSKDPIKPKDGGRVLRSMSRKAL